ncbi:hypothetical protein M422DRAFT_784677 [Sphaerobolus stellatus SS14]|uniref:CHAT domain-containing protein n=1 Tax=Sphaerobolus stellatus (strain SS14) TaxID=990650 RepID=A0A0C9U1N9_SPHS4|nr:hypothetical protein M422DRAFT_784677 [Sphaerobolus stellatus SS14]
MNNPVALPESSIDDLISALRRTLDSKAGAQEHAIRHLEHLSFFHLERYHRWEISSDLAAAIGHLRTAIQIASDDNPKKPLLLNHLARCYLQSAPPNLGEAASMVEIGLGIPNLTDQDRLVLLETWGKVAFSRFNLDGNIDDLLSSISTFQDVVDFTSGEASVKLRSQRLSELLRSLETQLRQPRSAPPPASEWNRLIALSKEILKLTPDGDPLRAKRLYQLGNYYLQLWFLSPEKSQESELNQPEKVNRLDNTDKASLVEALAAFRMAAISTAIPPGLHLHTAFSWATTAVLSGNEEEGFKAYKIALGSLARIAWLGTSIPDRYKKLEKFPDAGREAALVAITVREFDTALEWLEQSRNVVWTQLLHLRAPTDELRLLDPELADQLDLVSSALDRLGSSAESIASSEAHLDPRARSREMENHHELAEKWLLLVNKARSLPGFERFLLPKTVAELSVAARHGPVVVLHAYGQHCHALIVTKDSGSKGVTCVPLEGVTMRTVEALQTQFMGCLTAANVRQRGEEAEYRGARLANIPGTFSRILAVLWGKFVKPVLNALSISVYSGEHDPPRIWWCPTGPLAFLPLHAAGIYSDGGGVGQKVFEYVVSSYTPTLTVLLEHIQKSTKKSEFKGLLAVSQPATPHQAPIPKSKVEVAGIMSIAATKATVSLDVEWLNDKEATVENVLKGMVSHSWIHLACHAVQNPTKPTHSAFMLQNGLLPLLELIKKPLPHAEFAFLSACQTASGDMKIAEEAVHLASGMLMAGYHNVIATMWSIRDQDGPVIADAVYSRLLGNEGIDSTGAALALHRATAALRVDAGEQDFLSWVPFIHFGL